jgi:hypothetical protein
MNSSFLKFVLTHFSIADLIALRAGSQEAGFSESFSSMQATGLIQVVQRRAKCREDLPDFVDAIC